MRQSAAPDGARQRLEPLPGQRRDLGRSRMRHHRGVEGRIAERDHHPVEAEFVQELSSDLYARTTRLGAIDRVEHGVQRTDRCDGGRGGGTEHG